MLIIDVGVAEGDGFSAACASDESNLVYTLASTQVAADHLQAQQRSNLRVFCLPLGADGAGHTPAAGANLGTANLDLVDLNAFMTQQAIAEVDLLRLSAASPWLQVIKSAGDLIHNIKCIRFTLAPAAVADSVPTSLVAHLEAVGFRQFGGQFLAPDQCPSFDFVRVYRYAQDQSQSAIFDVEIPYVGVVATPKQDLVGQLLEQHLFEGPEQAFLWLYLRPGDTFFDCGAHVGVFSCIAARQLQNQGQIVGFDPNHHNLALYRQNLEALGCTCFTAMAVGLSDQEGEAPFFLGKDGLSAYGTFADGAKAHAEIGQESIVVRQVTLDSVIESLDTGPVTLAKLDVEGWEVPVLMGATHAIIRGLLPVWMIEFTEENAIAAGSSTKALADCIEHFGYTLCRFDATQLRLTPETRRLSYNYDNLFAVLDLEQANRRLTTASPAARRIAQAIVDRWDGAQRLREAEMLLGVCERDSADRLEALHRSERDSADRLEALHRSERDSADRLEIINQQAAQISEYQEFESLIRQLKKMRHYTQKLFGRALF